MRIVLAQIIHEANSFAPQLTRLEDFRIRHGAEIVSYYSGARNEVTGFLEGAAAFEFEAVPTLTAVAVAGGPATAETYAELTRDLLDGIARSGAIDGVLLALHGAFTAVGAPDADTRFVQRVRAAIGPQMPLV